MATRTPRSAGRERTGHADTPRQDSQRPAHADHADVGGEESTTRRSAGTQRVAATPPADAPPAPGELHEDPPLPRGGRQPQRPGQDGRAEDVKGGRDDLRGARTGRRAR
jgi:hypothetical protein